MKRSIIIGLGLGFLFAWGHANAVAVEYVKICYNNVGVLTGMYMPGTDQCLDINTERMVVNTINGPVITETTLAAQVSRLEKRLKELHKQFGIQDTLPAALESESTIEHINTPLTVDYVQICNTGINGTVGLLIPGTTDACLNANTGQVSQSTATGVFVSETVFAARISRLEMRIKNIFEQFGIQESLPSETENK